MAENLRDVTHSHALQALRQTPNRVKLVIHREDDEIYETLEVELLKKKDRGLGLSIVGKKSGPGVFISEVVKGKIEPPLPFLLISGRKKGYSISNLRN